MPYLPLHATLSPLRPYKSLLDREVLVSESRRIWRLLKRSPHWNKLLTQLEQLAACDDLRALRVELRTDAITAELSPNAPYDQLVALCRSLISWRIGPYQLGTFLLDTEWRSALKWSRIEPLLPHEPGMKIADVGCSSGYFLFKLSMLKPEIAIGFDPIERCWLQFALLQTILRVPRLAFVPMGLLALNAFPNFFDLTICMGVLYHQRDQARAIQRLYQATKPGGTAVLESLVVDQECPLDIDPPNRYAKMRNAWRIPSARSLEKLFIDAGFKEVQVHRFGALSTEEQRRAEFAPFESLADFLDPQDPSKTVEGHPAPHTAAVIGIK